MVGYEMLAQEQRDLTPEQVRNEGLLTIVHQLDLSGRPKVQLFLLFVTVLKLTAAVFLCSKAAEKLRNLPEGHYRSKQKEEEKQDEGK